MKKWQKLLAFSLTFCAVVVLALGITGMLSSGETYIEISTAEQLRQIGVDTTNYPLDGNYILTADIDLSGEEWIPIGLDVEAGTAAKFTGTFDGKGHVITGLHRGSAATPASIATSSAWGLFYYLENGTVKNLLFEDVYVNIAFTGTGNAAVGTVCGYIMGSSVIDSVAVLSGSLNATLKHQLGIAGIAGGFTGTAGFTIKNCYNGASISGTSTYNNTGSYAVAAGIVSRPKNDATNSVINCLNVGKVYAKDGGTSTAARDYSLAGHMISYQNIESETTVNATTRANNFAIEGLLTAEGVKGFVYTHDAEHESLTVLSLEEAKTASNFAGLGSGWTLKDGYYPLPASLNADYAVPVGTVGRVISIETAAELRKIGSNDLYPMTDVYYRLMNDIDLSGVEWTPLGSDPATFASAIFYGVFDGQGYTISNMHSGTADAPVEIADDYSWGFFNGISNGVFRNVFFKDVDLNVFATNAASDNSDFAMGAVCGFIRDKSVIENVAVTGTIRSLKNAHQVGIGGIAGGFTGTAGYVIRNCFNGASLSVSTTRSDGGSYAIAGGIIGRPKNDSTTVGNTIENCLNVGKIFAAYDSTTSTATSYSMPGHIVSLQGDKQQGGAVMKDGFIFSNNYGISGTLSFSGTYAGIYKWDSEHTNVVDIFKAEDPAQFSGLTSGENSAWTVKASTINNGKTVYYYPMLKTFVEDSVPVDVIYIETAEELRKIGVDAAYPMNGSYKLMNDIDLSDAEWVPIGDEGNQDFVGSFNGNGKVISGMHIGTKTTPKVMPSNDDVNKNHYNYGLFEFVGSGAKIYDLAFEDLCLNVNLAYQYLNIGAVSGYVRSGASVENVAVLSGYISGTGVRQISLGGVIGRIVASGSSVENCFNAATVIAEYTGTSSWRYAAAAGIVGDIGSSLSNVTVKNCLNIGQMVSRKAGTGASNVSSVGNVIATPRVPDITGELNNTCVIANNYGISGTLTYVTGANSVYSPTDAKNSTVVDLFSSGVASEFAGLTDGETSAWTVKAKDGETAYYPMLKMFADRSVAFDRQDAMNRLNALVESVPATNYMSLDDIKAKVDVILTDYALSLNLVQAATAAADGSWKLTGTLSDGSAYEKTLTVSRIPAVAYEFDLPNAGMAQGTVTVTLPSDYVSGVYALAWGNADGALSAYSYLSVWDKVVINGNVLTYTIPDRVVIPSGATHLWVMVDDLPAAYFELPQDRLANFGTLKYHYGVLSDTHISTTVDGAPSKALTAAMNLFDSANATFAVITGDMTNGARAAEFAELKRVITAGNWGMPVWVSAGNHDALEWNIDTANGLTPEQAIDNLIAVFGDTTYANESYTGPNGEYKVTVSEKNPKYDYTVQYGDELFIYMGIGVYNSEFYKNDAKTNTSQHLDPTQLEWLEEVLENHYNTSDVYGNVYLMFHYYTNESGFVPIQSNPKDSSTAITSGTGYIAFNQWSGPRDGFMPDWNSSDLLWNILSKHPNVIHFSGHSHRYFSDNNSLSVTREWAAVGLDSTGMKYTKVDEPLGYTAVHVPSGQYSEGYLVSVYDTGVMLTGYNFSTGKIAANANFFLPKELDQTLRVRVKENAVARSVQRTIQYVEGYGTWQDLATVEEVTGDPNSDIELQVNDTHVQWRSVGETEWNDLIAIEDIGKDDALIDSSDKDLTVDVTEGTAGTVYSVDILWENDDFTFDYSAGKQGDWNPEDHTFGATTEIGWKDSDLKVTVINHSNAAVKVTMAITDGDASDSLTVTADKTTETLATAEGTTVENAPQTAFTLTISGTPTADVTKVATATLTFEAVG